MTQTKIRTQQIEPLVKADITDFSDGDYAPALGVDDNYVTDAEKTVIGNTSGTNSGNVTLAGSPNYLSIAGQVITRALVNLTTHVTGILPVANGGTNNAFFTVSGPASSAKTYTFPNANTTIAGVATTQTLTNKRVTKRVGSTTSSATPTINTDNVDAYHLTAQAADITSFTTNLSGTPTDFQQLRISVTGTAARAITWGASFENGPVALPTTTVTTTRLDVLLEYSTVSSKWRCMASGSTA